MWSSTVIQDGPDRALFLLSRKLLYWCVVSKPFFEGKFEYL